MLTLVDDNKARSKKINLDDKIVKFIYFKNS